MSAIRSLPAVLAAPALAVTGLMLAVTVGLCAAPGDDLARVLPVEDGFYTLSVARQIGLGHGVTVDGVTATNGFQPLWAFVVAPFAALAGGGRTGTLRWALVLGTWLWLAFVPLVAAIARDRARAAGLRGEVAAACAAVVAAGSVSVLRIFHNVLETGLLLVLLAAVVLLLDRTEPWTPRRAALLAVLLAALAWTRLDAVAFVGAAGLAAAWRARRAGRAAWLPLAAAAVGAAALAPWLIRDLSLDGHLMPTSGRAEAHLTGSVAPNLDALLRALGAWSLAPGFHPSMHQLTVPVTELVALAGVALVGSAWWRLRRAPVGPGTVALAAYCVFLAGFYTFGSAAWWFADRYLAPFLLLALPALAAAGEGLAGRTRARALPTGLAALVLVLNVPLLVVLLVAPRPLPPSWSSGLSNLATHPNLNYRQVLWTSAHVWPGCRVGAFESGTLGYFRDRVTNLDGKVDSAALDARLAGRTDRYVQAKGIDVLVDIPSGIVRATRRRPHLWTPVTLKLGRFQAWVRRDRRSCIV